MPEPPASWVHLRVAAAATLNAPAAASPGPAPPCARPRSAAGVGSFCIRRIRRFPASDPTQQKRAACPHDTGGAGTRGCSLDREPRAQRQRPAGASSGGVPREPEYFAHEHRGLRVSSPPQPTAAGAVSIIESIRYIAILNSYRRCQPTPSAVRLGGFAPSGTPWPGGFPPPKAKKRGGL